ncbi:MAG TPA: DNA topoisomerase IB [Caulobacteraceae bacterium]
MSDTAGAADEAAEAAGLRYVTSAEPGIGRRRAGRGFRYVSAKGQTVTAADALNRIRRLAIPPAWREVWICADPRGHLQALGKDARRRTQYLYHPEFRAVRDRAKFEHILEFACALPAIRRRVAADMGRRGLGRNKVLATVVHLLETTMIRVGNRDYAAANSSYGLTTLCNRHVSLEGQEVRFHFKGKSGRDWRVSVRDRRAARIVRALQDLPGQLLFQYADDDGALQAVSSADVNAYLREISGAEVTAKDFRTWAGTVLAAVALASRTAEGAAPSKRSAAEVIAGVAASLGNTPTICRKCYVHPHLVEAYLNGGLALRINPEPCDELGLDAHEAAVLAFLKQRAAQS